MYPRHASGYGKKGMAGLFSAFSAATLWLEDEDGAKAAAVPITDVAARTESFMVSRNNKNGGFNGVQRQTTKRKSARWVCLGSVRRGSFAVHVRLGHGIFLLEAKIGFKIAIRAASRETTQEQSL
jgi:hypothetical protein